MFKHSRKVSSGYTLMEIMIVVMIIGVLAAVAMPAYKDYVRRGTIPEATAALSDYRIKMEQYFQDNRNYGTGTACANSDPAPAWSTFHPADAKNFSYECVSDAATNSYVITATGLGRAAGHVYQVSSDASRPMRTTQFKGTAVTDKYCWLVAGNEC